MTFGHRFSLLAGMLGLCVVSLGAGCSGHAAALLATVYTPASPPVFDQVQAFNDLKQQVAFGFRIPGTPEHETTRDWLVAQLKPLTASVSLQHFSKQIGAKTLPMDNVIADIPGVGPTPRERVLLCAHWDSRPIADHDPNVAKRHTPIPGADDGASGVAVLLEIARQLKAHPIARDVTLVLFDGEDYGPLDDNMMLGSKYYAANLPQAKPAWGILLDMIGNTDLKIPREAYSEEHAPAVNDRVWAAAHALALMHSETLPGFVDTTNRYIVTDDHTPLNEAGLPVADLIDMDYPAWHTVHDTVDKCSPESLRIVGLTVLYAITQP